MFKYIYLSLACLALLAACTATPAPTAPAATLAAPASPTPLSPAPPSPTARETQVPPRLKTLEPAAQPQPPSQPPAGRTPGSPPPQAGATRPAPGKQSGMALVPSATFTVTNPTSGAALHVAIMLPKNYSGGKLPALVLVPGGISDSRSFLDPPYDAQTLAEAGFVAVMFDPDGRGQSGGREDQYGTIHQDGLAAVIRFAAALPQVDASRIGLASFSFGVTAASGVLARYPDLPVRFLIDWEGPADRNDTGGCDAARTGHLARTVSCTDEAFWAQREASKFIAKIRVPYQRIQSAKDHAQPDVSHALVMVNAAVAGGAPWVRLNDDKPNQTYDLKNPPAMLPETMDRQQAQLVLKYAKELLSR